ncbi:hypothetical protein DUNSADRAFT_2196 [Dunaliella salina]|uniref:Uncharacterized protein n=1 Tax=Dunaliella salina TaxID=3046 RepID=A0ABQ7GW22_DUNSA|nr:hypothetical protein DUNSADRAFT_2196 [Dunaliella salina]KAF5838811.1 hypothetical protein DUNSADRAFT_2196 [Dunaliella salina]|eukprot:KAF5838810.1 hypothetical protein DUNSADRAFT_2196 [Dunaliella salina]
MLSQPGLRRRQQQQRLLPHHQPKQALRPASTPQPKRQRQTISSPNMIATYTLPKPLAIWDIIRTHNPSFTQLHGDWFPSAQREKVGNVVRCLEAAFARVLAYLKARGREGTSSVSAAGLKCSLESLRREHVQRCMDRHAKQLPCPSSAHQHGTEEAHLPPQQDRQQQGRQHIQAHHSGALSQRDLLAHLERQQQALRQKEQKEQNYRKWLCNQPSFLRALYNTSSACRSFIVGMPGTGPHAFQGHTGNCTQPGSSRSNTQPLSRGSTASGRPATMLSLVAQFSGSIAAEENERMGLMRCLLMDCIQRDAHGKLPGSGSATYQQARIPAQPNGVGATNRARIPARPKSSGGDRSECATLGVRAAPQPYSSSSGMGNGDGVAIRVNATLQPKIGNSSNSKGSKVRVNRNCSSTSQAMSIAFQHL